MSSNSFYIHKTDRELYNILKVSSNSTYDEKVIVQKILSERNFDFENVEKYKDKWELEKLQKEIQEEEKIIFYLKLWYNPDFLFLFSIVLFASSVSITIQFIQRLLIGKSLLNIESIVNIIFLIVFPILSIVFFKYSGTRRKYIKSRRNRIGYLKEN